MNAGPLHHLSGGFRGNGVNGHGESISTRGVFHEVVEANATHRIGGFGDSGAIGSRLGNGSSILPTISRTAALSHFNTRALIVPDLDFQDNGLDEDLGQQHIDLGDHVGDHGEILFVGEDKKRIGTLVRHDARIGEQFDFFFPIGRLVDHLPESILKAASIAAHRCLAP